MKLEDLTQEEVEVIKAMIKREQAVSWLWKWLRSFVFVAAGGIVTLYAAFEILKGTRT